MTQNGDVQHYATIVIVGGGCYGTYYVRQLGRARVAATVSWERVLVVDRDEHCAAAQGIRDGSLASDGIEIVVEEWGPFFQRYLDAGAARPETVAHDAIVPSPLMPHLMYEWLRHRARLRWPHRTVETVPLPGSVPVPWQRAAPDGTRYVSFAEWICPVNCIEPATCPKTRGPRSWTMPAAAQAYVDTERGAGRAVVGPVIFHCTHRTYGVGMFDTEAVIAGDAVVRAAGTLGPASVLVGTVSHCHGALNILGIGG